MSKPKPEPVPQRVVCSICGLDWDRHSDNPDIMECIELLKADLAASSLWSWTNTDKTYFYPTVTLNN